MQRNDEKCREMQRNDEKCREMLITKDKCREMQRNAGKCSGMQCDRRALFWQKYGRQTGETTGAIQILFLILIFLKGQHWPKAGGHQQFSEKIPSEMEVALLP